MSSEFLSRWARRKAAARLGTAIEEEATPAAVPPEPPQPAEPPASGAGTGPGELDRPREPGAAGPAALTPEEIAALPAVETLTAETDVSLFLRAGVPEALRKAALRKAWSVDPAIRDFVGHARDYAWDWNTPGGVPGSGALTSLDLDVVTRRIVEGPEPAAAQASPDRAAAASPETPGREGAEQPETGPVPPPEDPAQPVAELTAPPEPTASPKRDAIVAATKRHGSALPA